MTRKAHSIPGFLGETVQRDKLHLTAGDYVVARYGTQDRLHFVSRVTPRAVWFRAYCPESNHQKWTAEFQLDGHKFDVVDLPLWSLPAPPPVNRHAAPLAGC